MEQKPLKDSLPFFSAYSKQNIKLLLRKGREDGEKDRQKVTNMVTYTSSHLLLPFLNSPLYTVQRPTASQLFQVSIYFQTPSTVAVFKVSTKLDTEQEYGWDASCVASAI